MTSINEYTGVTGYMRFDGRWDNIAPIVVAQCVKGQWVYTPAPKPRLARTEPK